MIRLRFVTVLNDFASWAISGAELGFWATHVEAVKPDGTAYLGARSGSGVTWQPKGYDAKYNSVEQFVDVPATAAQEAGFWAFLEGQLGAPYDDSIIKGFAAGMILGQRDWHDDGHWICSELQAAALEDAKILRPFPQGNFYITPKDVLLAIAQIADVPPPPVLARRFVSIETASPAEMSA